MKKTGIAAAIALLAGGSFLLDFTISTESFSSSPSTVSVGQVSNLISAYEKWKTAVEQSDDNHQLILHLGYWKGLSSGFTKARGRLTLDLERGVIDAEVIGLPDSQAYELWLVDSASSESTAIEVNDHSVQLGRFTEQDGSMKLTRSLQSQIPEGFSMDLALVTQAGMRPEQGTLLYASPSLFQRLYSAELQGMLTRTAIEQEPPKPFAFMMPKPAHAAEPGQTLETLLTDLVSDGEKLFFGLPPLEVAAQFGGNGRTCGT